MDRFAVQTGLRLLLGALIGIAVVASPSRAVSPAMVEQGRILFKQEFEPQDPQLGRDGLGPLFNGKSCVACHHQGGVGGSGDARFNAKTVSIERFKGPTPKYQDTKKTDKNRRDD